MGLSFLGAFLVLAFLVAARAIREAAYLEAFDAKTLPYITGLVVLLGLPAATAYGRTVYRLSARGAQSKLIVGVSVGLVPLWYYADHTWALVGFYLWTTLGSLLLTSGFWIMTAELFPVRSAKRLFGLISAGGTLGAMLAGTSLLWLAPVLPSSWYGPLLAALLLLLLFVQSLLERPPGDEATTAATHSPEERYSVRQSLREVRGSPQLRMLATIVFVAALLSGIVDYQFKELAQNRIQTGEGLAAFFGAFYGWTGAIALGLQLVVTGRLLAGAGVTFALGALPALVGLGSVGLLLAPSLVMATSVRGMDYTLRKSVFRSVIEFLWVPVPISVRRRTKAFIDAVADSAGEGMAAVAILMWVTLGGQPSRYLSVFVIGLAAWLVWLSRHMGVIYFATLQSRLRESVAEAGQVEMTLSIRPELLSATFRSLDVTTVLDTGMIAVPFPDAVTSRPIEVETPYAEGAVDPSPGAQVDRAQTPLESLEAADLTRLLANNRMYDQAVGALVAMGEPACRHLAGLLRDPGADFVLRRRIPKVLADIDVREADEALIDGLGANRFEVRYRSAMALARRRRIGAPEAGFDWREKIWDAIRAEVSREKPVWELQRLLDGTEPGEDDFVQQRLVQRGALSLEHTFRLLSLVLERETVRSAYLGVTLDEPELESFSLEYLEMVLPQDIRTRLWPFIGDSSEYQLSRSKRPLDRVVTDLMQTGATLFGGRKEQEALQRLLDEQRRGKPDA